MLGQEKNNASAAGEFFPKAVGSQFSRGMWLPSTATGGERPFGVSWWEELAGRGWWTIGFQ